MLKVIFLSGLPASGKSTFRKLLASKRNFVVIDNDEIRKELYKAEEIYTPYGIKLYGLQEEYILIIKILKDLDLNLKFKQEIINFLYKYKESLNRLREFNYRIKNNFNKNKPYILELERILNINNINYDNFNDLLQKIENKIQILDKKERYTIYDNIPHTRNKEVYDIFYKRIQEYASLKKNIIIDGTNLEIIFINRVINITKNICPEYDYFLIYWWDLDINTIKDRNNNRKFYQRVPNAVIDNMYASLLKIKQEQNLINIPKKNFINVSNLSIKEYKIIIEKIIENS